MPLVGPGAMQEMSRFTCRPGKPCRTALLLQREVWEARHESCDRRHSPLKGNRSDFRNEGSWPAPPPGREGSVRVGIVPSQNLFSDFFALITSKDAFTYYDLLEYAEEARSDHLKLPLLRMCLGPEPATYRGLAHE